jgi:hypothetical protein
MEMINIKRVPIGTLLRVERIPLLYLDYKDPTRVIDKPIINIGDIVLLLEYYEGITDIVNEGRGRNPTFNIFNSRILVVFDNQKFWIVTNFSANTEIINLPEDLKNGFRETNMFDIIEAE